MKKSLVLLASLLLAALVLAQEASNSTSTVTTVPGFLTSKGLLNFLSSINPLFLIVAGILLILWSNISKLIGYILIIVGIIYLILSVI